MDKAKYCKRVYDTNQNFKKFCDKLVNPKKYTCTLEEVFERETVFNVAQYYEKEFKEPKVTKTTTVVSCGCNEQEDKSC